MTDRAPHARRPERAGDAGARILLLDDDTMIRRTTAAILRDAGHIVADPDDADSALDLLDAGVPFDLAILDLSMPDMRGDVFATEARRYRPGLPVLFLTGYPRELSLAREAPLLQKPYRRTELLGLVDTTIRAGSPVDDHVPSFEIPLDGARESNPGRPYALSASETSGDR